MLHIVDTRSSVLRQAHFNRIAILMAHHMHTKPYAKIGSISDAQVPFNVVALQHSITYVAIEQHHPEVLGRNSTG